MLEKQSDLNHKRPMVYIKTEKVLGRQRNRPIKDYSGQRFGRLVAVSLIEREPIWNGHKWLFHCDCGGEIISSIKCVKSGNTSSCGCLHTEWLMRRNTTHGLSKLPEYKVWKDMRSRCGNRRNKEYSNYGGRGIKVCERWSDFSAFYADMGNAPYGTTIDRKDVDGHYEPNNCRWASQEVQANNKRNTIHMEIGGKTKSLSEWCRHFGISRSKVQYRLKHGVPVSEAFRDDLDLRK